LAGDFGEGGITEVASRVLYRGGKSSSGSVGSMAVFVDFCFFRAWSMWPLTMADERGGYFASVFFCQSRESLHKTFFERNGER
jgi:hypothetical protein